MIKRKQAIQRTIHKLNKKSIFSEREYSNLYPEGSKIARHFGTPEINNLFHQVLFLLCDLFLRLSLRSILSFATYTLLIINSLNISVLYFHHIFP